VALNCGALVDTLLEGELFGHERGAYTDARERRHGLIAHADGGTVFLDEAETLTPRAQVTLLRVLQERTYRPLGSTMEHHVDARFVAATNTRLDRMVKAGAFRADLYYRLCVFSVALPPLRERRDDLLVLSTHFLEKHAVSSAPALSPRALEAILSYDWPGNIRELESAIVRAVHLARNGVVEPNDLGMGSVEPLDPPPLAVDDEVRPYKAEKRRVLDAFERHYLTRLMTEHRGNVSRAARAAGKERRDLGKLLKRHGFDPKVFAA
jgi:DNA-binding NtrC family response regulator